MPTIPTAPPTSRQPTARAGAPSRPVAQSPAQPAPRAVDPRLVEDVLARMRGEQRFGPAVVAGLAAALVGAIAWAGITVGTKYQIGWMAVGVGALVGITMRKVGRGVEARFGCFAALFALAGCLLGNLLAAVGLVAAETGDSFFELLGRVDFGVAEEILAATFSPMDLLFYGIAVMEAFKLGYQRVDLNELQATVASPATTTSGTPPT